METIKGIIDSVVPNYGTGKNGKPYTRWVFVIDGHKYATFDENIGKAGFKIGDCVEMLGEQNGAYWNMSTMQKSTRILDNPIKSEPTNLSNEIVDLLRKLLVAVKELGNK
jgi:hypothetical protein